MLQLKTNYSLILYAKMTSYTITFKYLLYGKKSVAFLHPNRKEKCVLRNCLSHIAGGSSISWILPTSDNVEVFVQLIIIIGFLNSNRNQNIIETCRIPLAFLIFIHFFWFLRRLLYGNYYF